MSLRADLSQRHAFALSPARSLRYRVTQSCFTWNGFALAKQATDPASVTWPTSGWAHRPRPTKGLRPLSRARPLTNQLSSGPLPASCHEKAAKGRQSDLQDPRDTRPQRNQTRLLADRSSRRPRRQSRLSRAAGSRTWHEVALGNPTWQTPLDYWPTPSFSEAAPQAGWDPGDRTWGCPKSKGGPTLVLSRRNASGSIQEQLNSAVLLAPAETKTPLLRYRDIDSRSADSPSVEACPGPHSRDRQARGFGSAPQVLPEEITLLVQGLPAFADWAFHAEAHRDLAVGRQLLWWGVGVWWRVMCRRRPCFRNHVELTPRGSEPSGASLVLGALTNRASLSTRSYAARPPEDRSRQRA